MLLPWVLPGAISAVLWVWVFHPSWGVINSILRNLGLIDSSIPWLTNPKLAFVSVTVAHIWTQIPFTVVLLLAALSTLNPELTEAAKIDGATPLQLFRLVYLPLMTPSLIAIGTYALLLAWNEYLYAVLLLQGESMITLPVGMGNFLTSDDAPWNLLMALSVIYSIPPVIFYYIFRRYLTHGLVSGAVQGT